RPVCSCQWLPSCRRRGSAAAALRDLPSLRFRKTCGRAARCASPRQISSVSSPSPPVRQRPVLCGCARPLSTLGNRARSAEFSEREDREARSLAAVGVVLALRLPAGRARRRTTASRYFDALRARRTACFAQAAGRAEDRRGLEKAARQPSRSVRMSYVSRLGMAGALVALSFVGVNVPVAAQVNLAGVWTNTYAEDWPDRIPGPEL